MQDFVIALGISSVSVSAVALVYMAASPILARRYSPKWLYCAWLVLVVGLIIPFRPGAGISVFKLTIRAESSAAWQSLPTASGSYDLADSLPDIAHAADASASARPPAVSIYHIIGLVWLAGAAFALTYNIVKHRLFMRTANRWSEAVSDAETLKILYGTTRDMAIFSNVKLKVCPFIKSPMMIGLVNPTILIHAADIPKDELAFIIRHELTHCKRRHLWHRALILAAQIIHWFNPIVYLMSMEIAMQCEISCDWEVVRDADGKAKQQYSETMIGVIRKRTNLRSVLSTSFYGGKRGMKKRIYSIMDTAPAARKSGAVIALLAIFLTLGTGMVFAVDIEKAAPYNQAEDYAPTATEETADAPQTPLEPTVTPLISPIDDNTTAPHVTPTAPTDDNATAPSVTPTAPMETPKPDPAPTSTPSLPAQDEKETDPPPVTSTTPTETQKPKPPSPSPSAAPKETPAQASETAPETTVPNESTPQPEEQTKVTFDDEPEDEIKVTFD